MTLKKMNKELKESNKATNEHKAQVFNFMKEVCISLLKRAFVHDDSKLSDKEAPYYAKAKKLDDITYGTPEYYAEIKRILQPALDHHYKLNRHHPEFHENGFKDMTWMDKIEMLVDWKSACLRHKDGDIRKSIEINQKRYGYSDKEKEEMTQFLKDVNLW